MREKNAQHGKTLGVSTGTAHSFDVEFVRFFFV